MTRGLGCHSEQARETSPLHLCRAAWEGHYWSGHGGSPKLGFGHVLSLFLHFSIFIYLYVALPHINKYMKNIMEQISAKNQVLQVLEGRNETR